jgi:hypothetical protein
VGSSETGSVGAAAPAAAKKSIIQESMTKDHLATSDRRYGADDLGQVGTMSRELTMENSAAE